MTDIGYHDQLKTAARHARDVTRSAIHNKPPLQVADSELKTRIITEALTECHPCRHLTDTGPQPVYALLELRSCVCGHCLGAVTPLDNHGDWCDWCGEPTPINNAATLVVNYGPAVIVGAACPECAAHLEAP